MSDPSLPAFQRFEQILNDPEPDWDVALALLTRLEEEGDAEKAFARLRQHRLSRGVPSPKFTQLKIRLGVADERARERRAHSSRLDVDRGILRLRYSRSEALAHLNPAQFLALLTGVLRKAGLDPDMSLEKTPRPLVALGHPLPLGLSGSSEWADAEVRSLPKEGENTLLASLNAAAAEGLKFHACSALPAYATPVLDLSLRAHWTWLCPPELSDHARRKMTEFEASESFFIEKMGKERGQKLPKRIEVRPMVEGISWENETLRFAMQISAKNTLNPVKLLAGILGIEPGSIKDLKRNSVELAEDLRVSQAERFEPKLRNIYEDAVLLSSGPTLSIVDEDEDEPLKLG